MQIVSILGWKNLKFQNKSAESLKKEERKKNTFISKSFIHGTKHKYGLHGFTFRFVRLLYQLHIMHFFLYINTVLCSLLQQQNKRLLIMYHNDGLQKLITKKTSSLLQSM